MDEQCHLFGGTRLLNSVAQFASSGGLREAASWVFLRQDIYVALTLRQLSGIHLDNYKTSSSFHDTNDGAWANRMVFIFAKVLWYALLRDGSLATEQWSQLEEEVETWYVTRPWHFRPLWLQESGDEGSPFPQCIMSHPAHGKCWLLLPSSVSQHSVNI